MKIQSKNLMWKKSVLEKLLNAFWLAIGPSDPRHLLVLMDGINDFTFSTFWLSKSLLDAKVIQTEVQNDLRRHSKSKLEIVEFHEQLRVGSATTRRHPIVRLLDSSGETIEG